MASDRARNVLDMFEKILAFDGVHAAEYVALAQASAQFTRVSNAHAAMEAFIADQTSGSSSAAVAAKSLLKAAARRRMRDYARTAQAMTYDDPGIEKEFKMPAGNSDSTIIARGRQMMEVVLIKQAAFTALGMPPSRRAELIAILDDIEAKGTEKDTAEQSKVGATAGIDSEIDEGMEAATILDAIMRNFYRDDDVTLAEWRTARHIKAASSGGDEPPTP